jgi:hypothetical protein
MVSPINLKKIYKRYIDIPFYRVMPLDQKLSTMKRGLDPSKDPYKKVNPKIKIMYKIINRLEKNGTTLIDNWRSGPVTGSIIVKVNSRSIDGNYIDFVGNKKQIRVFKKRWVGGGCLVTYVLKLTSFLLEHLDKLNTSERKLVKYLNKWANKRKDKERFTIYIRGSNKIFETALFYCYRPEFKEYWASPFGSFDNFKEVIKKDGLKRYLPYLKNEKLFYLRVINKISPKEIKLFKSN